MLLQIPWLSHQLFFLSFNVSWHKANKLTQTSSVENSTFTSEAVFSPFSKALYPTTNIPPHQQLQTSMLPFLG